MIQLHKPSPNPHLIYISFPNCRLCAKKATCPKQSTIEHARPTVVFHGSGLKFCGLHLDEVALIEVSAGVFEDVGFEVEYSFVRGCLLSPKKKKI